MRVRMRVSISGTRGGSPWPPAGGVLECGRDEGEHLCRAGLAEPAPEPRPEPAVSPEEHAVVNTVAETAVPKARKPRKSRKLADGG